MRCSVPRSARTPGSSSKAIPSAPRPTTEHQARAARRRRARVVARRNDSRSTRILDPAGELHAERRRQESPSGFSSATPASSTRSRGGAITCCASSRYAPESTEPVVGLLGRAPAGMLSSRRLRARCFSSTRGGTPSSSCRRKSSRATCRPKVSSASSPTAYAETRACPRGGRAYARYAKSLVSVGEVEDGQRVFGRLRSVFPSRSPSRPTPAAGGRETLWSFSSCTVDVRSRISA